MMYQADSSGRTAASLEDYIAAVRQRYWAVIAGLIVGLVLALWFQSSRVEQYEAEAKIVLGPTLIGSTNGSPRAPVLEREAEIVASDRTATAAAATVSGVNAERIIGGLVVDFVPKSEVISIRFRSEDPTEAANVANAVADSYVADALEAESSLLTGGSNAVATQAAAAEAALIESQAEVDRLTLELGELRRSPDTAVNAAAIDRVTTELSSEQASLSLLTTEVRDRRRELALNDQSLASLQPPAEVLSSAQPGSLVGIPGSLVLVAGTLLGAIVGLVTAVVGSRLDRTARDETSVAASLGTRVLGALPRVPFSGRSPHKSLFMSKDASGSWVAGSRESIRRLRSSVQFVGTRLEPEGGVVLTVTSAFPRGKVHHDHEPCGRSRPVGKPNGADQRRYETALDRIDSWYRARWSAWFVRGSRFGCRACSDRNRRGESLARSSRRIAGESRRTPGEQRFQSCLEDVASRGRLRAHRLPACPERRGSARGISRRRRRDRRCRCSPHGNTGPAPGEIRTRAVGCHDHRSGHEP